MIFSSAFTTVFLLFLGSVSGSVANAYDSNDNRGSNSYSINVKRASAWNGHVDPGSTTPAPFRPFWVPPGSEFYDDNSPVIVYQGDWTTSHSSKDNVNHTLHSTTSANAQVTVTFTGTGIEWFGNTGKSYGFVNVFLDGTYVERVNGYDKTNRVQQRLWYKHNLAMGAHTLKLTNVPSKQHKKQLARMDVDAFVVIWNLEATPAQTSTSESAPPSGINDVAQSPQSSSTPSGNWGLSQVGETGVHAMQFAVISSTRALVVDKVEHNPATINGHPAWAAIYDFSENKAYPIQITSNSFCAGGTFLSNGTMINVGGNPVVEDHTNSADFGDLNGLQGVRILSDCHQSGNPSDCVLYESPKRIRLASSRWYNSVIRLSDGSAMIIGGSKAGGWINNATVNNPTFEYFPPKGDGLPVKSQFLIDTLNSNLFPIAFSLPNGRVFIAANQDAMIYDWQANTEQRLPQIPNGVRVTYPMAGTGVLLPLDPENDYTPEILLCGGSSVDDTKPGYDISSQDPASNQCSRLVLTDSGIAAGWSVEQMPQARIMPDAVLLPTGDIFIVNGGQTGISGYGNVKDQVGSSNADNPEFTPMLYSPNAQSGSRFNSAGIPSSDIPRLYHSVATLVPDGHILVAGSNPNLDRSTITYQTEYRVEHFTPPYMNLTRPNCTSVPEQMKFGQQYPVVMDSPLSVDLSGVKVSLMDFGYVTHATHSNSRLVYLKYTVSADGKTLTVTAPPSGDVYPPGPGWLFIVVNGTPSIAQQVMIGDGNSPPVDENAIANMLKNS